MRYFLCPNTLLIERKMHLKTPMTTLKQNIKAEDNKKVAGSNIKTDSNPKNLDDNKNDNIGSPIE